MSISVIIPVYNAEQTLERCLRSVLAQTYKNFEIILIDDGSKDNSLILAKKFAAEDSRIVLVTKKNGGVSSARNAGLRMARNKYVQFIDADDDVLPEMFQTMMDTIERTDADMVTCRFKHDCWKPYLPAGEYNVHNRKECLKFFSDFFTFNVPWNKLIKRSAITAYFNENIKIFEDGLFVLENFVSISKIVVLENVFYNYFNAGSDANSAVNAFLKTKFWENKSGYWFKQLLIKEPFENALSKIGFERTESFIRTRMFDMAFVELVKLIHAGTCEDACVYEMFTIFSEPEFADSLNLFHGKHFVVTFEATKRFVKSCFNAYAQIAAGQKQAEPIFEYMDCFFASYSSQGLAIFDIISQRLLGGGSLMLKSQAMA